MRHVTLSTTAFLLLAGAAAALLPNPAAYRRSPARFAAHPQPHPQPSRPRYPGSPTPLSQLLVVPLDPGSPPVPPLAPPPGSLFAAGAGRVKAAILAE